MDTKRGTHVDHRVLRLFRRFAWALLCEFGKLDRYLPGVLKHGSMLGALFSMESGFLGVGACTWGPQCPVWTLDS